MPNAGRRSAALMHGSRRAAIAACAAAAALAAFASLGNAQELTPRPTPLPQACARPNVAATVVKAVPAARPPIAAQLGSEASVQVVVSLDANSNVVGTRIQSSPSAELNQAALAAARQTIFQTEIRDCRPLAADFIYVVDFVDKVTWSTTSSGERTVTVVANGMVTRVPDTAVVQAQITTHDDVSANATAQNDAMFEALTAKLRALGIDETKIRSTSFLRALPTHGYVSSRQVEIAVDTIAIAGHAAAAAASLASVDRVAIRFSLNDRTPAYREALNIALKDAENSARDAVTAQRLHLGVLRQVIVPPNDRVRAPISVVPYHLVPVVGGFTEPDVHIPELAVHATATVTYAVKP